MDWRRHFVEAFTLIAAAVLCALVSNAIAGRERKMLWSGTYPNALKVPPAEAPPPTSSGGQAPSPVPVVAPTPVPTPPPTTTTTATTATAPTATRTSEA